MNYTITPLSNSTLGDVNNLKGSSVGNTTYVAWQSNLNNTNHIFIAVTNDQGFNYSKPIQLSPLDANASELQMFASENEVSLIWFDHNQTTGKSSIFGSRSVDNGQHFSTYMITFLDTEAFGLALPSNYAVLWIQKDMCGGGPPPPPPPPPPDNKSTSAVVPSEEMSNQTAATSTGMPPFVACAHRW